MTKIMTAIALAIALPGVASAQTAPAPAPAPKAEQGQKGMDCKAHQQMAGNGHAGHHMPGAAGGHAGHGTAQPGANAPNADLQHNHQK